MTRREEGSILVEALVATAVVALILLAMFQTVTESAERRRALALRREALLVAQAQMAAVGYATPLSPGVVEGRAGADLWRVEMQPCGSGASAAGRLFCVAVSVRGEGEGPAPLATLQSRRLAPAA